MTARDNRPRSYPWLKEMTNKLAFGPKFNGQIVAIKKGEFVTDQVSGTMYCTQGDWEALRAEIDRRAKLFAPSSSEDESRDAGGGL